MNLVNFRNSLRLVRFCFCFLFISGALIGLFKPSFILMNFLQSGVFQSRGSCYITLLYEVLTVNLDEINAAFLNI